MMMNWQKDDNNNNGDDEIDDDDDAVDVHDDDLEDTDYDNDNIIL
jgi:hypothetical protein